MVFLGLGGLVYLIIFLVGLSLGSFLNSLIWRARENIRIVKGRSICPGCRRQLAWYENIPVFSYIFLFGKCRTCKMVIPRHFIFVELGTAILFTLVAWHALNERNGDVSAFHLSHQLIFVLFLVVIFIYDLLYQIILSEVVWVGVILGFIFNFYSGVTVTSMLIGCIVGAGFFLFQYLISRGKWIGGGDVRMGAMMGVWLGWPGILPALAIAYILGAIFSLLLIVFGGRKFSCATPFGTYLAIGTFITMLWGSKIIGWYISMLG
ncbi:MAG: prepilin peptidase [Patescibacteria group bacterium]